MIKLSNDLIWNKNRKILTYKDNEIYLTKSEEAIFKKLIHNIDHSVSAETLFYEAFDYDKTYSVQAVRVLVAKLRKKIPAQIIENIYGSEYIIRNKKLIKNQNDLVPHLFDILDQVVNGIVITDPMQEDNPIIYANRKFLEIFKYSKKDILGKNCRLLQKNDRYQENISLLRDAINNKEPVTVPLINYTKNGEPINVEVTINPIFDKNNGQIKYFLGIQRELL